MPRGSFSRTVARAAASGGSRSYRARRPYAWYVLLVAIVAAGVVLIAVSRNDHLRAASPKTTAEGPSKSANWNVALAFDICGTIQPNLGPNTNISTVGIRTFGNGLINITPAVGKTPADFEGAKATLGLFVKDYSGLTLSASELKLPVSGAKLWTNGATCSGPLTGKGSVQVKVWSSPSAKGTLHAGDPSTIHLNNREMITVAFVPTGASIPEPSSKSALATS